MFMKKHIFCAVLLVLVCFDTADSIHERCRFYTRSNFRFAGRPPSVRKCCCHGEALESGAGCVNYSPPSAYISHINESYSVGVGFPTPTDISPEKCNMTIVSSQWFISEVGSLVVNADQGDLAIVNYCIDDLLVRNKPSPRAVTCAHELKKHGALPISAFRTKTIGKCCPRDEHFSSELSECVEGAHSDMDDTIPGAPNNTQLGYTGIPDCPFEKNQNFPFKHNGMEDHVRLAKNLSLIMVFMDEHCIEEERLVKLGEYCLDYTWSSLSNESSKAAALMCLPTREPMDPTMRSAFLTVFLSISCIALILTIAFLITLKAKGILSHVTPQIGLLAPRTHLAFVGTVLISFIALADSIHKEHSIYSSSCRWSAGILMFFLLSGYFWNTALCVESFLVISRIGSPGWKRFFMHMIWAYGIPGVIVIIAFSLDANRWSLSCDCITPRIGRFACFISDANAQWLYFYLPIFVSLIVDAIFLAWARYVRHNRLRRLELGAMHHKKHGGSGGIGSGKSLNVLEDGTDFHRRPPSTNNSTKGSNSSIARFGLSTRETQMLMSESIYLASWSLMTFGLEVLFFILTNYASSYKYNWHSFIWWIPGIINSIRGIGIFVILIILPKDSRYYIYDLISTAWEKCGGKPLKNILPPTRRSSTSTTTTATTSTNLSPSATADKERISLSSSDTQLSSRNASMGELHEIHRCNDGSLPESILVTRSNVDISDLKVVKERHSGKILSEAAIEVERQRRSGSASPQKTKGPKPVKPPRKSLENLAKYKAAESQNNSNEIVSSEDSKILDSDDPVLATSEKKLQNFDNDSTASNKSDEGNGKNNEEDSESHSDELFESEPPALPSSDPPSVEESPSSAIEFSSADLNDIMGPNSMNDIDITSLDISEDELGQNQIDLRQKQIDIDEPKPANEKSSDSTSHENGSSKHSEKEEEIEDIQCIDLTEDLNKSPSSGEILESSSDEKQEESVSTDVVPASESGINEENKNNEQNKEVICDKELIDSDNNSRTINSD